LGMSIVCAGQERIGGRALLGKTGNHTGSSSGQIQAT
jgi:hypothetical protein